MTSSNNNQNSRRRLEEQRELLENERSLRIEKLKRLRNTSAFETDVTRKFQLANQIEDEETEVDKLNIKIELIEEKLESKQNTTSSLDERLRPYGTTSSDEGSRRFQERLRQIMAQAQEQQRQKEALETSSFDERLRQKAAQEQERRKKAVEESGFKNRETFFEHLVSRWRIVGLTLVILGIIASVQAEKERIEKGIKRIDFKLSCNHPIRITLVYIRDKGTGYIVEQRNADVSTPQLTVDSYSDVLFYSARTTDKSSFVWEGDIPPDSIPVRNLPKGGFVNSPPLRQMILPKYGSLAETLTCESPNKESTDKTSPTPLDLKGTP